MYALPRCVFQLSRPKQRRAPIATALLLVTIAALCRTPPADAATIDFSADFSASQSVWARGPSGGFNKSGKIGSGVGINWSARANSGTVTADVNGLVRVSYPELVEPSSTATIALDYVGSSSSVRAALGASVNVSGFIPCVAPNPFTGNCLHGRSFDLIDEGFFVDPRTNFTASLDTTRTDTETDNALGIGPNINLIIGELGAQVNVDVTQRIRFTPTGVNGILRYRNRDTGETHSAPFLIGTNTGINIDTSQLSPGEWDFDLLSIGMQNSFRNDVDLDLRPTINYVLGSWPRPGNPLSRIGLVDETFSLDFGSHEVLGSFSMQVGLFGDYNADGVVDAADYTLWRDSQGMAAGTLANDPNPGVIGQAQYDTWLANFGRTTRTASAVPEPSGAVLLALAGLMPGRRRTR